MTTAKSEQIRIFHAILLAKGLMGEKESIVREISNGRAGSTKDLFYQELQEWIDAMNRNNKTKNAHPGQRMINNIIAMAREMGVIVRKPGVGKSGKVQVYSDYTRFNEWMVTKSCLKKTLSEYTYEELPKLVTQYKNIYLSWLKK